MRVYRYGLLAPATGRDVVLDELARARRYYNDLADIETGRRAALRDLVVDDVTVVEIAAKLDDVGRRIEAQVTLLKKERVARRGRVVVEDTRTALAALREERKAVLVALRDARFAARCRLLGITVEEGRARIERAKEAAKHGVKLSPYEQKQRKKAEKKQLRAARAESPGWFERLNPVERIEEVAGDLRRNARAHCGLYPGTYLRIEAAVEQAKDPPEDKRPPGWTPYDPIHHRFGPHEGTVGPQVQWRGKKDGEAPPTTNDLFDGDVLGRLVRISSRVPEEVWRTRAGKSGRDPRLHVVLRVRVRSDDRGLPVWVEFPMLFHRPLPKGVVKWVGVTRRIEAGRERWSCEITVDEEPTPSACGIEGPVVLHCGWLVDGKKIRVGNVMDALGRRHFEDGSRMDVFVPDPPARIARAQSVLRGAPAVSGAEMAKKIRSIRDRNFDEVRDALVAWMRANVASIPEWLREYGRRPEPVVRRELHREFHVGARWIAAWRNPAKIVRLVREWTDRRFPGDEEVFGKVSAWASWSGDGHLRAWERGARDGWIAYRDNHYRTAAARLARRYSVLVVDDADYSDLARTHAPDGVKLSGRGRRQDGSDAAITVKEATDANRRAAAPSSLRGCAINAFEARGGKVIVVRSTKQSMQCPRCGEADEAHKHVEERLFACASCGFTTDLDVAAMLNALVRAGYESEAAEVIGRIRALVAE